MSASPPARYSGSRSPSPRQDENRPRSMSLERPQRRQARSPTRPAHSKDTRYSLYVSGLSPKVTEDDLYEHFAKEGKVHLLHVPPRRSLVLSASHTLQSANALQVMVYDSACLLPLGLQGSLHRRRLLSSETVPKLLHTYFCL